MYNLDITLNDLKFIYCIWYMNCTDKLLNSYIIPNLIVYIMKVWFNFVYIYIYSIDTISIFASLDVTWLEDYDDNYIKKRYLLF